jgi:hypothetical protein
MSQYYSKEKCQELTEKYFRLADLTKSLSELGDDIRKLKNHPIHNYPQAICNSLLYWWELKGTQEYLLTEVYDFLDEFKNTRNQKLKKLLISIKGTADEIIKYESIN